MPRPRMGSICVFKGYLTLLFLILFSVCSWGSDFFDQAYKELNANIETGNYSANFAWLSQVEESYEFESLGCYNKGRLYHKIGVTYYLDYQERNAVTFYNKVLQLWEHCGQVSQKEKANTLYNLGISHQYLGNTEDAKTHLDRSLSIFETVADYSKYELGLKYHGIGLFYESISDLFRAQLYFSNAANLFEQEAAIAEQFEVLNSTITLYMGFNDYVAASKYVERARELAQANSDLVLSKDLVPIYLNAATIAFEQKEFGNAEDLAKKTLSLVDQQANPEFHATGLEIMAFLSMEREHFGQAEQLLQQVLRIREQFSAEGSGLNLLALTHENFAELYLRQGALDKANEHLAKGFHFVAPDTQLDERYVPNVSNIEIKNDNTFNRLMDLKARIFDARYEVDDNVAWLQHSINVKHKIDSVIKRGLMLFQFEQSKLDFLDVRFKYYGQAVKDALRLYELTKDSYYLKQAHQFSAQTKAIVLQQELNRINALRTSVSNSTLNQENILRERMNLQQSLLFEADDDNKKSLQRALLKAQNELDAFLVTIEREEPTYYQERYKFLKAPSITAIQNDLPKDMAVIEFFETQSAIYVFWISSVTFFSTTIPLTDELKQAISAYVDQCGNPNLEVSQSASLLIYKQIMESGLAQIGDVDRLCIIPDGLLHSVSFEALQNSQGYLIEEYAFSYVYALNLINREYDDTDTVTDSYVGFSASYSDQLNERLRAKKRFFGGDALTPLSFSKKEVEQAATLLSGRTFLDAEATLENFYKHVGNAGIVHLSLHGLVDADDPSRSCIIFDDSDQEFLLSPPDLYKNHIKADLVLLSACHSANGRVYKGEGVQGMSKSFLLAGAQNVLSSLWNASEYSSMEITQSFLMHAKDGTTFDRSLRKAKLDYLSRVTPSQRHPYYWANFILLGKGGQPVTSQWSLISWSLGFLVIGGIAISMFLRRRQSVSSRHL